MSINVLENATSHLAVIDIYSKLLQNDIIFINDEINSRTVSTYQAEIMFLMQQLKKSKEKKINIYINSPGGSIYDLFGLYDIIQLAKKEGFIVSTVNVGIAASAAAILLMSGTKGYRFSLPNCRVMVHELAAHSGGKFSDLSIEYNELKSIQERLKNIIKENSCEEVANATRDYWCDADKAKELNIIDNIL